MLSISQITAISLRILNTLRLRRKLRPTMTRSHILRNRHMHLLTLRQPRITSLTLNLNITARSTPHSQTTRRPPINIQRQHINTLSIYLNLTNSLLANTTTRHSSRHPISTNNRQSKSHHPSRKFNKRNRIESRLRRQRVNRPTRLHLYLENKLHRQTTSDP